MTASVCTVCTRPVGDGSYCCRDCADGLARNLGDVRALTDELDTSLSRQARQGGGPSGVLSKSAETPLPWDQRASEAGFVLRNVLVANVRVLVLEQETWPADTCPAMAAWLLVRMERIRHFVAVDELVDEVRDAVGMARRVIDLAPYRTTFPVGPCPDEDEDGVPCPGELRAFVPAEESIPVRVTCEACRRSYDATQWMHLGKRLGKIGRVA